MLVEKLTPERLVSAPQRSSAVPNHDGSLALYSEETHEIGGRTRKMIKAIDIETSKTWVVVDDDKAYDATWVGTGGSTSIMYLKTGELGMTWLMSKNANRPTDTAVVLGPIPGPVKDLKLKVLQDGSMALAVMGHANGDGKLFNPELQRSLSHSGMVFDAYPVRECNSSVNYGRCAIWYTRLEQDGHNSWRLSQPLRNVLRDTELEVSTSMDPHGGDFRQSSYDLSERGIIMVASRTGEQSSCSQPPQTGVYYIPLLSHATDQDPQVLELRVQSAVAGICSAPRFNKDGSMIGFIHASIQCPEARQIYIKHVHEPSMSAISVSDMVTGHRDQWHANLVDFSFSPSGHFLYLTARECGRIGLFKLDLQPNAHPQCLLSPSHGSCHAVYPLHVDDDERVLVTTSSFVESSLYQVVLVDGPDVEPMPVSSLSRHGAAMGLSRSQVSEIYFEGGRCGRAGEYFCHAHVVRPRNFYAKKRHYPLAILVHDGPIGAWDNAWNPQWNAAVWAEQGYVVVLPNISGSMGFGPEFSNAVRDSWGGRPFDDLVNLLEHLRHVPGIDTGNAVIAGAGYGGYMMNWIQGQDFGRKFKAIVSHAGIFSIPTYTLTSDHQDHGALSTHFGSFVPPLAVYPSVPGSFPSLTSTSQGPLGRQLQQYDPEGLERYNPARPDLIFPSLSAPAQSSDSWTTPMLIVHGERDYRVPVTESLAAFRICQSHCESSGSSCSLDTGTNSHGGLPLADSATNLHRNNTTTTAAASIPVSSSAHNLNSHTRHLSMLSLPRPLPSTTTPARNSLELQGHRRQLSQQRRRQHNHQRDPRSRLVLFPDEGHTIKSPENLLEWYRQVFAWTNRWTGITARQAFREFIAPMSSSPAAEVVNAFASASTSAAHHAAAAAAATAASADFADSSAANMTTTDMDCGTSERTGFTGIAYQDSTMDNRGDGSIIGSHLVDVGLGITGPLPIRGASSLSSSPPVNRGGQGSLW